MSSVRIRASARLQPQLRRFAQKVVDYLKVHPVPDDRPVAIELLPARLTAGHIAWEWNVEQHSTELTAWRAMADKWLNENVGDLRMDGCNGVLVRVVTDTPHQACGGKNVTDDKKIIKGDGLAEFFPVQPKFRFSDLIVSDALRSALLSAVSIVKHTDLIYEKWGFRNVEPVPRAVMNFFGPPGTGKTMAAHGVADELGKKIVIANFAEIESKYVGDSPKNLENIFRVAEAEDAVLFFDEADSFLGKRLTSVTSSSDQAVNSLRSKLLQLLEDFHGVVIFCTNLLKNYDKAFESRILRSLKFDLPDDECRRKLIRQKIPHQVPFAEGENLDESTIAELSSIAEGFSGREIKNAVLQTLCKAALEGRESFSANDFIIGFKSAAEERNKVLQEEGGLSKERASALSKEIKAKLEAGDYEKSPAETA